MRDDAALAVDLYRTMTLVRATERALLRLYAEGHVHGTVHTCLGQEGNAAAVLACLDRGRDLVWSNHRGHGHYLAWTDDVEGLLAEVLGRATGTCRGVGGSQHLHRPGFWSNGILGGTAPQAVGCALAEQAVGSGAVVTLFHGDGAMAEGAVAESLNMAALWGLPLLLVVEANGWAQSTPTAAEHAVGPDRLPAAFGIPVCRVDAGDPLAVWLAAREAVASARTHGPQALVLATERLGPHSKGDDDRDEATLAAAWARDPLTALRARLPSDTADEADAAAAARVEAATAAALAAQPWQAEDFAAEAATW